MTKMIDYMETKNVVMDDKKSEPVPDIRAILKMPHVDKFIEAMKEKVLNSAFASAKKLPDILGRTSNLSI